MAGVFNQLQDMAGGAVDFSGFGTMITALLVIFLVSVVGGVIIYLVLDIKKYNRKIIIFENIAGRGYNIEGRDKAKVVKVGDGGEEIFRLKKRKVFRSAYGKKIGKNTYAFAVGSDGYWRNIAFGDVDNRLKELRLEPIDRDMRYMHVAIRKNVKDSFQKESVWQKYGGVLASVGVLIILAIFMWLIFDKFLQTAGVMKSAMETAQEVLDATSGILTANDNILSGGGGLQPAS